ncbi:hypothetical protein [Cellulomonas bogoriensis]|uniref:Uncharacterized protein n=1 Tax=Cellulomonas bogoriensis 69B4 = DSM 16987 TaxID=1386082 RepID=A0A0A0C083_9CELL|nr:hypothetical protein [Cellulomonas bogoriensis]KGM14073.1 hypothetical protein N869_05585 [Cellulomonas bogoriensis 69B4 = DSM 16987]
MVGARRPPCRARLTSPGCAAGPGCLASSRLLFILDAFDSYAEALHGAAHSTVTGSTLASPAGAARVVEVVLGVYSVAVFATLAGALGAFFLQSRGPDESQVPAEGPVS